LVLELLQRFLRLATEHSILLPLGVHTARLCASFSADAATVFINPRESDVAAVQRILQLFGDVSGLRTNIQRSVAYPISCYGMCIKC
jgi:hypothetical protein